MSKVMVELDVIQHPSYLYGRDYFLGDIVTTRVNGIEVNRTIGLVVLTIAGQSGLFAEVIDIGLEND